MCRSLEGSEFMIVCMDDWAHRHTYMDDCTYFFRFNEGKVFNKQASSLHGAESAMCLFIGETENQSGGVMGPALESPNGLLQSSSG